MSVCNIRIPISEGLLRELFRLAMLETNNERIFRASWRRLVRHSQSRPSESEIRDSAQTPGNVVKVRRMREVLQRARRMPREMMVADNKRRACLSRRTGAATPFQPMYTHPSSITRFSQNTAPDVWSLFHSAFAVLSKGGRITLRKEVVRRQGERKRD